MHVHVYTWHVGMLNMFILECIFRLDICFVMCSVSEMQMYCVNIVQVCGLSHIHICCEYNYKDNEICNILNDSIIKKSCSCIKRLNFLRNNNIEQGCKM